MVSLAVKLSNEIRSPVPARARAPPVFLSAAAYTLLGEILCLDYRPAMGEGRCWDHSRDHLPMLLVWAALVCPVSTSWIATRV
jgi:hypothetical protein